MSATDLYPIDDGHALRVDHRTAWVLDMDRGRITGSELVGEYAAGTGAGWVKHPDGTETRHSLRHPQWVDTVRAARGAISRQPTA